MLFFSHRLAFRRRCRRRLKDLGWVTTPYEDLMVDFLGGLKGKPYVFICRPSDTPLNQGQVRDLQEIKLRYPSRRMVCITEGGVTPSWVRETAERGIFLVSFAELESLLALPISDDDALHAVRAKCAG